jgi:hypothetical protein
MEPDLSRWSGDGDFTRTLVDALKDVPEVVAVRVEDAPASTSGAGYALLSNEVYVAFADQECRRRVRLLGVLPWSRRVREPALTLPGLETRLASLDGIGPPDYSDEGMLQYLRTERIVQPYQTRGVKLVELVRIYAFGTPRRE